MKRPHRSEMLQKFGHAGGHLRDALLDALDCDEEWWKNIEIDFLRERHNRWWDTLSDKKRAHWLLGQLWNCTDIVPSFTRKRMVDDFGFEEEPFTYSQLARELAQELKAIPKEQGRAA